jgi:hypothetical protein
VREPCELSVVPEDNVGPLISHVRLPDETTTGSTCIDYLPDTLIEPTLGVVTEMVGKNGSKSFQNS